MFYLYVFYECSLKTKSYIFPAIVGISAIFFAIWTTVQQGGTSQGITSIMHECTLLTGQELIYPAIVTYETLWQQTQIGQSYVYVLKIKTLTISQYWNIEVISLFVILC
jgi:hypothetical protein